MFAPEKNITVFYRHVCSKRFFDAVARLLSYPALRRVSTPMALSRASSVMTIVETGIRKDFMGHVIILIHEHRLQVG